MSTYWYNEHLDKVTERTDFTRDPHLEDLYMWQDKVQSQGLKDLYQHIINNYDSLETRQRLAREQREQLEVTYTEEEKEECEEFNKYWIAYRNQLRADWVAKTELKVNGDDNA